MTSAFPQVVSFNKNDFQCITCIHVLYIYIIHAYIYVYIDINYVYIYMYILYSIYIYDIISGSYRIHSNPAAHFPHSTQLTGPGIQRRGPHQDPSRAVVQGRHRYLAHGCAGFTWRTSESFMCGTRVTRPGKLRVCY